MLDISIVTHNSAALLERLVQSLLDSKTNSAAMTLWFYDNASHDRSVPLLHELKQKWGNRFAGFEIHAGSDNLGFGRSHNANAARGEQPFLFILNPDARPDPDCLQLLLTAAATSPPEVAAWEPRQIPYEHPKVYDPVTLRATWCSGAALLLRREAFARVRGFESRIFLYGEDVDLSFRLQDEGFSLRFVPQAIVDHRTYDNLAITKPSQLVWGLLAMLYLRTRYGSTIDLLRGIAGYWRAVLRHPGVASHRRTLIANFFKFLRNWIYFARTSGQRRRFYGSDYALHRDGAFREIKRIRNDDPVLPLVSVLIRTTGRQRLLRDALRSVRNQTYGAIEVVLVEDGPRTLDTLVTEFSDLRVQYVALGERQGRCRAGNLALEQAQGEYLVFLDDDDLYFADHIEQLMAALLEAGEIGKVAYSYSFELPTEFAADGETIARVGEMRPRYRQTFVYLKLLLENYIPNLNVLFHRSVYEEHGGFAEHLDNLEDWNLWVRYASTARPFIVVPKTTAVYRVPLSEAEWQKRNARLHEYLPLALEANRSVPAPLRVGDFIDAVAYVKNAQLQRWLRILLQRML